MMSEKRQFFKHTLIFGFGGIIVQITPFILLPLYTNYLPPSDYGTLNLIIIASDIINTVFLMGGIRLATMTFYKQAESEEERRRIAATISSLLWGLIVIAIAASIYFVDYIDLVLKTGDKKILSFGLAVALLDTLVAVPMVLMQARLESLRFVLVNITKSISRLGLCIFFVAGLHWGIWGVLSSQAIVMGTFAICLTYRELRIGSIYPDVTKWKEILKFALPLVPNGILAFFYATASRFFILHFGPYEGIAALAAVGIYSLAERLVGVSPYIGTIPMQQVWRAEMYDVYKRPNAPYAFGNFMFRLLCVQVSAVLLLSVSAIEILRIMSEASYHDAAALVPLYGICALFVLFAQQMNNTFFITRKTNHIFFCTALSLPFLMLLMYLLVPRWGITGAAIAWMFSQTIYAGIVYGFTQRLFFVHYPFGRMAALLAITFFCYGVSLFCGNGIELSSLSAEQFKTLSRGEKIVDAWDRIQWFSLIAKMGVFLLWGILIWFSGVLFADDKAAVIRILKKGLRKILPQKKEA